MAIESTCVDHRKYLHWHLQVLSFFCHLLALVGVVEVLEISSRIERAYHRAVGNVEVRACPAQYRLIHKRGV